MPDAWSHHGCFQHFYSDTLPTTPLQLVDPFLFGSLVYSTNVNNNGQQSTIFFHAYSTTASFLFPSHIQGYNIILDPFVYLQLALQVDNNHHLWAIHHLLHHKALMVWRLCQNPYHSLVFLSWLLHWVRKQKQNASTPSPMVVYWYLPCIFFHGHSLPSPLLLFPRITVSHHGHVILCAITLYDR